MCLYAFCLACSATAWMPVSDVACVASFSSSTSSSSSTSIPSPSDDNNFSVSAFNSSILSSLNVNVNRSSDSDISLCNDLSAFFKPFAEVNTTCANFPSRRFRDSVLSATPSKPARAASRNISPAAFTSSPRSNEDVPPPFFGFCVTVTLWMSPYGSNSARKNKSVLIGPLDGAFATNNAAPPSSLLLDFFMCSLTYMNDV
mmetsp:Transcript_3698/g.5676  ORF Transcript_3698/g.5676 Transcript_3698/m.5676 type:complete len:201 (+) Transcript_3698:475-1077(+)